MPGQPAGFDVVAVIPTEPVEEEAPALVIQCGQPVKLKAYLHFKGSQFVKAALDHMLTDTDPHGPDTQVVYHLQDLVTGAMVPPIFGGAVTALDAVTLDDAIRKQELPASSRIGPGEGYWVSADTAPITTAQAPAPATLQIPAGYAGGTWRVLTHVHSAHPSSQFAAFDDNLVIEVTT